MLVRKFQAFSSSYGVKVDNVSRPSNGGEVGDFDVLSILGDTSLLYIECKTGKFDRDAIVRMVDRGVSLHCSASIMVTRNKLVTTAIKAMLDCNHPALGRKEDLMKVKIRPPNIEGPVDQNETLEFIYKWGDVFFLEADETAGSIEDKLRIALRLIAASRVETMRDLSLNTELCRSVGFLVNPVD